MVQDPCDSKITRVRESPSMFISTPPKNCWALQEVRKSRCFISHHKLSTFALYTNVRILLSVHLYNHLSTHSQQSCIPTYLALIVRLYTQVSYSQYDCTPTYLTLSTTVYPCTYLTLSKTVYPPNLLLVRLYTHVSYSWYDWIPTYLTLSTAVSPRVLLLVRLYIHVSYSQY